MVQPSTQGAPDAESEITDTQAQAFLAQLYREKTKGQQRPHCRAPRVFVYPPRVTSACLLCLRFYTTIASHVKLPESESEQSLVHKAASMLAVAWAVQSPATAL